VHSAHHRAPHSFPTRRSSDLLRVPRGHAEDRGESPDRDYFQGDEAEDHREPQRLAEDRARIHERPDRDEEEDREESAEREHLAPGLLRLSAHRQEETRDERAERKWNAKHSRADARRGESRRHRDDEKGV